MMVERLTLDDLVAGSGLEKRTIRDYIQKGLLRGPEALGRSAYYTQEHLKRLQAIRYWRTTEGRSLEQIRALLAGADRDTLERTALLGASIRSTALTKSSPTAESAVEYLNRLADERGLGRPFRRPSGSVPEAIEPPRPSTPPSPLFEPGPQWTPPGKALPDAAMNDTALDRVLLMFEQMTAGRVVPRRARSFGYVVIPITPDIELHVRGAFDAEQLARLERIADYLREVILGGI
jgi:DNA-binding transcriptional MerR regulator